MHITTITPTDHQAWDDYVSTHSKGGPYLTTAWKTAMEQGYGLRTFYLAARKSGSLTGVLPLALIRPPLGNSRLVSLPYCDYGGIVADSEISASALLDQAFALAREQRAGLEIRNQSVLPLIQESKELHPATDKCRLLLELPGSSGLLWSGFKSKLRSQIKKPSKEGLMSRLGHKELLPDFYSVFCRNMRDLGSPVHSRQWIQAVLFAFGSQSRVAVVSKGDIPVGAGIILASANMIVIPWASTLREYNSLSPNMLLYWSFLEYAADNGFAYFDFGRSTPGEGTYAFKSQWGARPVPLAWYRLKSEGKSNGSAEDKGSLRSTSERLWRSLPLPAANFLGPRIRKYIDL